MRVAPPLSDRPKVAESPSIAETVPATGRGPRTNRDRQSAECALRHAATAQRLPHSRGKSIRVAETVPTTERGVRVAPPLSDCPTSRGKSIRVAEAGDRSGDGARIRKRKNTPRESLAVTAERRRKPFAVAEDREHQLVGQGPRGGRTARGAGAVPAVADVALGCWGACPPPTSQNHLLMRHDGA